MILLPITKVDTVVLRDVRVFLHFKVLSTNSDIVSGRVDIFKALDEVVETDWTINELKLQNSSYVDKEFLWSGTAETIVEYPSSEKMKEILSTLKKNAHVYTNYTIEFHLSRTALNMEIEEQRAQIIRDSRKYVENLRDSAPEFKRARISAISFYDPEILESTESSATIRQASVVSIEILPSNLFE